jgi:spore germination cell wall hydrolase CwlJ-like protein
MKNALGALCFMLAYASALGASDALDQLDSQTAIEYGTQGAPSGMQFENAGHACVALAVFAESRGEGYDGQAAVAQVILNRLALMPKGSDACDVVTAPGQFEGIERWSYPRRPWAIDAHAWQMAIDVTDAVVSGDYVVSPPACAMATSFHRAGANEPPSACRIRNHVFSSSGAQIAANP